MAMRGIKWSPDAQEYAKNLFIEKGALDSYNAMLPQDNIVTNWYEGILATMGTDVRSNTVEIARLKGQPWYAVRKAARERRVTVDPEDFATDESGGTVDDFHRVLQTIVSTPNDQLPSQMKNVKRMTFHLRRAAGTPIDDLNMDGITTQPEAAIDAMLKRNMLKAGAHVPFDIWHETVTNGEPEIEKAYAGYIKARNLQEFLYSRTVNRYGPTRPGDMVDTTRHMAFDWDFSTNRAPPGGS
jgi:hypothetical protein